MIEMIEKYWGVFLVGGFAFYWFLRAAVRFYSRIAKITPNKEDDARAKVLSRIVDAIGKFFKDLKNGKA